MQKSKNNRHRPANSLIFPKKLQKSTGDWGGVTQESVVRTLNWAVLIPTLWSRFCPLTVRSPTKITKANPNARNVTSWSAPTASCGKKWKYHHHHHHHHHKYCYTVLVNCQYWSLLLWHLYIVPLLVSHPQLVTSDHQKQSHAWSSLASSLGPSLKVNKPPGAPPKVLVLILFRLKKRLQKGHWIIADTVFFRPKIWQHVSGAVSLKWIIEY